MTREELNDEKQKSIFREENREKRKKTILKFIKFFILFIIIFYAFSLYTTYISTGSIIVKEERIINSKIPNSFNGTKIIQFSDLHYGSNIDLNKVSEIVKLINDRNPDLVLFTGDLVEEDYDLNSDEQEKLINKLKSIKASLGKYAVSGDQDTDNFTTIMNQSDFIILNNEYDLIYNKTNDVIALSGFGSNKKKNFDISTGLEFLNDEKYSNIYTISMFHEPDSADQILKDKKVDLLLAGHSHNGNIRVPFLGSIIKHEGAKKYDQEFYQIGKSKLYVSSGLGTENDGIRLFCKPSINFFRISNS